MAVQALQSPEFSMAEIALIVIAIPRSLGGNHLDVVVIAREGDHGFGDYVVSIETADHLVYSVTVDIGVGTGARFEMDLGMCCQSRLLLVEGRKR